jgi:hypothetical protein|tara:strand:+ start:108 stop:332 length:225 start_codon:yes stop_codon:yes gene_type:complete
MGEEDELSSSFEGMSTSRKKLMMAKQQDEHIVAEHKQKTGRMAMKKVSETVVASAMGEVMAHLASINSNSEAKK